MVQGAAEAGDTARLLDLLERGAPFVVDMVRDEYTYIDKERERDI